MIGVPKNLRKEDWDHKTYTYRKHYDIKFEIGDIIRSCALDMYFIVYDLYWVDSLLTGYVVYSLSEDRNDIRINFMYEYQYEKVA